MPDPSALFEERESNSEPDLRRRSSQGWRGWQGSRVRRLALEGSRVKGLSRYSALALQGSRVRGLALDGWHSRARVKGLSR
eukprot:8778517-Pyramimonas_sp.AAC.1